MPPRNSNINKRKKKKKTKKTKKTVRKAGNTSTKKLKDFDLKVCRNHTDYWTKLKSIDYDLATRETKFNSVIPSWLYRCESTMAPGLMGICTRKVIPAGRVLGRYHGRPITTDKANSIQLDVVRKYQTWDRKMKAYKKGTGPKPRITDPFKITGRASYLFTVMRNPLAIHRGAMAPGMAKISKPHGRGMKYLTPPDEWVLDGYEKKWSSWLRFINATLSNADMIQNVRFIENDEGIYALSVRRIPKGSELITNYGEATKYIVTGDFRFDKTKGFKMAKQTTNKKKRITKKKKRITQKKKRIIRRP